MHRHRGVTASRAKGNHARRVCVFVCVCVCVHMHTCSEALEEEGLVPLVPHTHTHTHTSIDIHTHMYNGIPRGVRRRGSFHTDTHTHASLYIHTHTYIHTYIHRIIRTCTRAYPEALDEGGCLNWIPSPALDTGAAVVDGLSSCTVSPAPLLGSSWFLRELSLQGRSGCWGVSGAVARGLWPVFPQKPGGLGCGELCEYSHVSCSREPVQSLTVTLMLPV